MPTHEDVLNKILANLTPDYTTGNLRWFTIYDDSEGTQYRIRARVTNSDFQNIQYEIISFEIVHS